MCWLWDGWGLTETENGIPLCLLSCSPLIQYRCLSPSPALISYTSYKPTLLELWNHSTLSIWRQVPVAPSAAFCQFYIPNRLYKRLKNRKLISFENVESASTFNKVCKLFNLFLRISIWLWDDDSNNSYSDTEAHRKWQTLFSLHTKQI